MREQQYRDALSDGCAFQKRYMSLPFEVPDPAFRKTAATLESDDGIRFSSAEGLANLKPVQAGATVTFGGQTHPADGNAAIIVAEPERAGALSANRDIRVRLHGFGSARAAIAHMPERQSRPPRAPRRGRNQHERMDAVKTHNPFAVNDVLFSRQTGSRWRR